MPRSTGQRASRRPTTLDVLALRALGLGDLLTAVPALRALRDTGAHVTVAAPAALAPIARLAGCELLHAAPLRPLPAAAQEARLSVNLHGRGPQSHAVALAACPRRLIAFEHPMIPLTAGMPVWRADEHEVDRWCRLLRESGIPADPTRVDLPAPPLPPCWEPARGATVVHPGAASAARRWPAERFAAVAAAQARAGRSVILTGSAAERPLALAVAEHAGLPARCVLAGRTDLAALAAIVAHAGRVVCGDTGVAHLATAFGIRSVVLFGPTSPATWGPPAERAQHRVLWRGSIGDPHADRPDPGLLAIEPAHVIQELAAP
ncbi:glycosyltransferase family 9 protein [Baekduia sp.]|uniref:glycosyltransferase family 9 protein n=1 Tax=Baekduia sp. TaxID=2600305 RepID=UPI002E0B5E69|nr:glycosyltransferase family 9 protein [Baekduia sp.]